MTTILVIEDEEPIRELIKLNLQMAGYATEEAKDGIEGLNFIKNHPVDLVVLDVMLPKMDGYELLPHLAEAEIPVILLTAKDRLQDKVKGFNLGADDYITKPFESMELLARVKAVLRRSEKSKGITEEKAQTKLVFQNITLLLDEHRVLCAGEEVELTFKEFELLRLLVENKGIVLSRERLLEQVWGYEYEGNTRTVDIHIQRLRNKLNTEHIKTVYKVCLLYTSASALVK